MINFEKLIDEHLRRELKEKKVGVYYPSEIGSCIRKVWFTYKKPKEPDKDKIKIFQVGLMLHDFIADVLRSEKTQQVRLVDSEVPFRLVLPNFTISGRVDDIMIVEANGKKILVEVKSTKSLKMINEPQDAHVKQLQMYMHALKIPNGMIVYIEKSSLKTIEFEVEYDKEQVKDIMKRFETLHDHLVMNKIPEPEAKLNPNKNWMCKYCEYREECEGNSL
ncbi:MAG: PD-(D/E)XK nuclease family protein [Candidatus Aenigmarchaeota archaeon]|nr:PD-(D/E)XK nuclease family protein [Candidatus Aenigmarchaeota archaeon]